MVAPLGFLVYLAKELAWVLGGLGIQEDSTKNGRWGIEGLEFDGRLGDNVEEISKIRG